MKNLDDHLRLIRRKNPLSARNIRKRRIKNRARYYNRLFNKVTKNWKPLKIFSKNWNEKPLATGIICPASTPIIKNKSGNNQNFAQYFAYLEFAFQFSFVGFLMM